MDPNTQKKLDEMEAKLNAIFVSVEKTRKYLLVTMWVTIIVFVLPLVLLVFAIPKFISTYTATLEGLL